MSDAEELRKIHTSTQLGMNSMISSVYQSIGIGIFGFVSYCFCFWNLYYINKDILLAICATLSALVVLLSVILIGMYLVSYSVSYHMTQMIFMMYDEQGVIYKELQKEYPQNNLYKWCYTNRNLCSFFGSVIGAIAVSGMIAVLILVCK